MKRREVLTHPERSHTWCIVHSVWMRARDGEERWEQRGTIAIVRYCEVGIVNLALNCHVNEHSGGAVFCRALYLSLTLSLQFSYAAGAGARGRGLGEVGGGKLVVWVRVLFIPMELNV
jgi:hypothetical protein